jgi:hypothetical protein
MPRVYYNWAIKHLNNIFDMESQSNGRELTFGEKAVGLAFNPSGDPKVHQLKELYAQIVDICNDARTEAGPGEKGRLLSVAITEAQGAQMWAVKGVTFAA